MNEIKGNLEKTTQKSLQIFFWEKFKEIFFHVFPDENISGEWTDFFFFFFFKELRRHYIFMCETKWKETIRIVFGVFFLENISGEFSIIWKKCERISEEILPTFSMWNWVKKKKVFLFLEENLWGNFIMQNYF